LASIQLKGLKVAGHQDLKETLQLIINVDYRWKGYLNQRVLETIGSTMTSRLSHLKFYPDIEHGLLYIAPADKDEYGAEAVDYIGPENSGWANFFLALYRFNLPRQQGRLRSITASMKEVEKGVHLLTLDVRNAKLIPSRKLSGTPPAPAAAKPEVTAKQTVTSNTEPVAPTAALKEPDVKPII
jgi:hypothetical protein